MMNDRHGPLAPLVNLEAKERTIVLSFLALSERETPPDQTPLDQLALSMALREALKTRAN